MAENPATYRESLFQWVWEQLEFDCRGLKTSCGKRIQIIDPGIPNHGAGPDFLKAHLIIDGLAWHGSVEIHKTTPEWNAHHHEKDRNFNNVILHVVYAETGRKKVLRSDGTEPFTLCLEPYINKHLYQLLSLQNRSVLPCGNKIPFINQKAFKRQVQTAHKEYFNVKVKAVLDHYDPQLPPSEAWKKALIIVLYEALGIPSNRDQMKELAGNLISSGTLPNNLSAFLTLAEQKSGTISWYESGMRPASRPAKRIPQAAALHLAVQQRPFRDFLHGGVEIWESILSKIPRPLLPGSTRSGILKHTVFLPAIYLLGDLFQSRPLIQTAYESWENPPQQVPGEVIAPFKRAGFSVTSSTKKFGLAYQYKHYCLKHQCQRCEVFKSAIRS